MPIQFQDSSEIAHLATALQAASYNSKTLGEYLPWGFGASSPFRDAPAFLFAIRGRRHLHDIAALFLLQLPVAETAAQEALAPASVPALIAAGVLRREGSHVLARLRILPCLENLVVADIKPLNGDLNDDFVMGASQSSSVLLNTALRKPYRRALDLCSGSGIQAIAAAAHSRQVVALEKNLRAISMGRFAAALNGASNVEFRESDFLSAAGDEPFDFIVSNPPFVISPGLEFQFRDGGMGADRVTEHLVRNAPRHLAEGGQFHMLCDVANFKNSTLQDRVSEWAAGAGCDVAVFKCITTSMREYPIGWLYDENKIDTPSYLEKYAKWVEYFQSEGIESMTSCVIVMRRRTSPANWFHVTSEEMDLSRITGSDVTSLFDAIDFLQAHASDAALLNCHLVLKPEVRFDQRLMREDTAWAMKEAVLALADGHIKPMPTDPYIGGLCSRLNGEQPLGEIVQQMAVALRTEFEPLAAQVATVMRALIERGFVGWK